MVPRGGRHEGPQTLEVQVGGFSQRSDVLWPPLARHNARWMDGEGGCHLPPLTPSLTHAMLESHRSASLLKREAAAHGDDDTSCSADSSPSLFCLSYDALYSSVCVSTCLFCLTTLVSQCALACRRPMYKYTPLPPPLARYTGGGRDGDDDDGGGGWSGGPAASLASEPASGEGDSGGGWLMTLPVGEGPSSDRRSPSMPPAPLSPSRS